MTYYIHIDADAAGQIIDLNSSYGNLTKLSWKLLRNAYENTWPTTAHQFRKYVCRKEVYLCSSLRFQYEKLHLDLHICFRGVYQWETSIHL